ncbi:MAG: indole-3-glycerol phosphate synthase TrpC [Bryobacterales bacterium]|nr:indole-3-glycerol phosphate synthase TrpC [Bryobacterales bacterium]
MTGPIPDILARIVASKRAELAGAIAARGSLETLAVARRAARRDFAAALRASRPAFIAEIKRASPSKGALAAHADPAARARDYERGGAAALSVLTDGPFFQGSLADLEAARDAVSLPALRKDFTIDEYHVVEAAAHGADAILLIAAVLEEKELRRYRELAESFGMAALVEVHDAAELERAISSGAGLIGVNNRNLRTFEVILETSLRLAERIPAGALKVTESGIRSAADVRRLLEAGFDAFLVGERLMTAADPAAELRALAGAP